MSVAPLAEPPDLAARVTKAADRAGLDLVGIQDHPYQRRFLDTWTLISTLVPVTEHIRLFPDVANLPLRPPAMLAKAAASLDVLSAGRVEMGLGRGFLGRRGRHGRPAQESRRGRPLHRRGNKGYATGLERRAFAALRRRVLFLEGHAARPAPGA